VGRRCRLRAHLAEIAVVIALTVVVIINHVVRAQLLHHPLRRHRRMIRLVPTTSSPGYPTLLLRHLIVVRSTLDVGVLLQVVAAPYSVKVAMVKVQVVKVVLVQMVVVPVML
jgi:hypothetical protein